MVHLQESPLKSVATLAPIRVWPDHAVQIMLSLWTCIDTSIWGCHHDPAVLKGQCTNTWHRLACVLVASRQDQT